jgi:hypothetical protein
MRAEIALRANYLDKLPKRTYVLLGDGEMAEGKRTGRGFPTIHADFPGYLSAEYPQRK